MDKRFGILVSALLIIVGAMALACNLAVLLPGLNVWWWVPWRLWPLIVVGVGLFLVLPPFFMRGRRGLGALFIPGMPILTTGAILLLASLCNWWGVWKWLWPQDVLALALGFLFAAIYARQIWLIVPAIIIGLNGMLFQFCALTGFWEVWSVLWIIEPLSVGLAFLAVYLKKRSAGLLTAGIVMCALAGLGFVESITIVTLSAVTPMRWLWRWMGPVTLVLLGFGLLVWGAIGRPSTSSPNLE